MARSIWTGSLSFGLVNVPVGLYSATQEHEVRFHQFQKGTSARIRNQRVNEDTGDEVDYDDIVKGAEVGDGEYVMLTPEELESVEPGKSRTIDITDFVDATEIDPVHYQKSYYLAPKDKTGEKAYALLVRAMEKAERIGVATFVMRNKQYLAAIRPQEDILVLETMFFADEIRDPVKEIDQLPAKPSLKKKDVDMAVDLITAMTTSWDPTNYRDTYTERVEQLVKAKKNDREIVTHDEEEPSRKVVDLMQALQASLDDAKGHKPGNRHGQATLETRKRDAGDLDASDLTKSELSELARKLQIEGRSKMSREQLVKAVAKAQVAGQRAS
ncbi:MAG: Ku protein [Actinomycetota bacterium]|nr:Ku protein [Actinomycetota bacterium]